MNHPDLEMGKVVFWVLVCTTWMNVGAFVWDKRASDCFLSPPPFFSFILTFKVCSFSAIFKYCKNRKIQDLIRVFWFKKEKKKKGLCGLELPCFTLQCEDTRTSSCSQWRLWSCCSVFHRIHFPLATPVISVLSPSQWLPAVVDGPACTRVKVAW